MTKVKCPTCGGQLFRVDVGLLGCENLGCKLQQQEEIEPQWKASLPRAEFIKRGCYRIGEKDYRRGKRLTCGDVPKEAGAVVAMDADGAPYAFTPREFA